MSLEPPSSLPGSPLIPVAPNPLLVGFWLLRLQSRGELSWDCAEGPRSPGFAPRWIDFQALFGILEFLKVLEDNRHF